ncbi:hypothetical protein AZZ81_000033, partial [Klebsiella aerogenes]
KQILILLIAFHLFDGGGVHFIGQRVGHKAFFKE